MTKNFRFVAPLLLLMFKWISSCTVVFDERIIIDVVGFFWVSIIHTLEMLGHTEELQDFIITK